MTPMNSSLRFDPPQFLRIGPHGFLLHRDADAQIEFPSFTTSILAASTVRKRFLNGKLVCSSQDAHKARDGSSCDSCHLRSDCLPRIRLRLRPLCSEIPNPIFLELSFSSAKNFLDYFLNLQSQAIDPLQVPARLSVLNRGRWGEVAFSIHHPNSPLTHPENPCLNSSPPP